MKTFKTLIFMVTIFLVSSHAYSANLGDIYLRYIEGDVQIKTEDTSDWVPAAINTPLQEGDRVWVPEDGKAELQLRDGSLLRLDKNSFLEILPGEKNTSQFYLGKGHAYVNYRGPDGNIFIIDTPNASLQSYKKSIFRIDVSDYGDTEVSVLKGEIYAELNNGQMKISTGERLTLQKNTAYPILAKLASSDKWEQWNRQRDREFYEPIRTYSQDYLPDGLKVYSNDLDRNGKWVYTNEYGYAWTPTVIVVNQWSPYRVGRWVWMRGHYVWVSYEPWGWVPYHYGRWAHINSIGWCWVPPSRGFVYWGPGYVGWTYTPTHVSWVPLAPREIYYGHGYYGPYSVNITKASIHKTVIKNVYNNVYVNNAVTTVHRDTFIKGIPVRVKMKENLFLKQKIITGAPQIKPEKTTVMPLIKEIPPNKLPPQQIRNIEARELRKNLPAQQEKGVVTTQIVRPKNMEPIKKIEERKGADSFRMSAIPEKRTLQKIEIPSGSSKKSAQEPSAQRISAKRFVELGTNDYRMGSKKKDPPIVPTQASLKNTVPKKELTGNTSIPGKLTQENIRGNYLPKAYQNKPGLEARPEKRTNTSMNKKTIPYIESEQLGKQAKPRESNRKSISSTEELKPVIRADLPQRNTQSKSTIPATNNSHNTQTIKNKQIHEEVKKNISPKGQVTIEGPQAVQDKRANSPLIKENQVTSRNVQLLNKMGK